MTDRPTLSYTSTSEISTPSYTWRLKKVPLLGGASRTGHNIESTLPWGTKYDLLCQKRKISKSINHWLVRKEIVKRCNANPCKNMSILKQYGICLVGWKRLESDTWTWISFAGAKKSVSKRKGKRVSGGLGLSHGLHFATYQLHT